MKQSEYDIIVIGGGAAGMIAAGRAAERGRRVLLLEKNTRLGKKLSITGGGRCNITNGQEDQHLLLQQYGQAAKFLFSPFSQFGVKETFDFFTTRRLPIVIQTGLRAFPVTEKATDVVRALEHYLQTGQVDVRTKAAVTGFMHTGNRLTGVQVDGETLRAESYILATGGQSHPETGSTGDGFSWLSQFGHVVKAPTPTIVPLSVPDRWIRSLAGVALDNVKITFFVEGKKRLALKGRVLCTHFGLSGPLILNAAGQVADLLYDGTVTATIDLWPTEDLGSLDTRLTKIFDENKNKALKNVLRLIVPAGTAPAILTVIPEVDPEKKVHSISKKERTTIVHILKALPLSVNGLMGYERAVVADGGLALTEIDPKTMRSRKYSNLFVTGDLLDISRPSGGYSLQLCWTTGWVAGSHA